MNTTATAPTPAKSSAATTSVPRIPPGMHTITPHIVCADAAAAIEFYTKAFGAVETSRLTGPNGRIWHAQVKIGDSHLMLVDEFPEMGSRGPKALGGTAVTIHLYVDDADATFAQAIRAGCTVRMPLGDMFWGDRYGLLDDPFGHSWSVATHRRDVCEDEIAAAMKELAAHPENCCSGQAQA